MIKTLSTLLEKPNTASILYDYFLAYDKSIDEKGVICTVSFKKTKNGVLHTQVLSLPVDKNSTDAEIEAMILERFATCLPYEDSVLIS